MNTNHIPYLVKADFSLHGRIFVSIQNAVAHKQTYLGGFITIEDAPKRFENNNISLIIVGDSIVGTIEYYLEYTDKYSSLYIAQLAIDPLYQRNGYGKSAVKMLCAQFYTCHFASLYTHIMNPARKMYRSIGFKVVGISRDKSSGNWYFKLSTRSLSSYWKEFSDWLVGY